MFEQFAQAVRFLTIFPVGKKSGFRITGNLLSWFPVVGLIIGVCSSAVYFVTGFAGLSPVVSALCGVLSLSGFSGFLHIDGAADTADGFLSARPKDKILEIMRDSRVGTMGVVAIFFVFGFKWAALSSMPPDVALRALVLAPVAGRAAQVITMASLGYARENGGLASVFLAYAGKKTAFVSGLAALLAGFVLCGFSGVVSLFAAALGCAAFNRLCAAKINGMTGDTLGAVTELAETLVLCALCAGKG